LREPTCRRLVKKGVSEKLDGDGSSAVVEEMGGRREMAGISERREALAGNLGRME
jgi:hypothetical protein